MQGGGVNREAAIISERSHTFAFADLIPTREIYSITYQCWRGERARSCWARAAWLDIWNWRWSWAGRRREGWSPGRTRPPGFPRTGRGVWPVPPAPSSCTTQQEKNLRVSSEEIRGTCVWKSVNQHVYNALVRVSKLVQTQSLEDVCTNEFLSRKPGFLLSAMHSHTFRWFSATPLVFLFLGLLPLQMNEIWRIFCVMYGEEGGWTGRYLIVCKNYNSLTCLNVFFAYSTLIIFK